MTGLIVARVRDARAGMCNVEELGRNWFRLTPDRDPLNRLVRHVSQIEWRIA